MACYPCWALVPLLELSRSGTTTTRQLVRGSDTCLATGLRSCDESTASVLLKRGRHRWVNYQARLQSKDVHPIHTQDLSVGSWELKGPPPLDPDYPQKPHRCATTALVQIDKGSRRNESQPLSRRSHLKSLHIHPFIVYPSQSIYPRRPTRA